MDAALGMSLALPLRELRYLVDNELRSGLSTLTVVCGPTRRSAHGLRQFVLLYGAVDKMSPSPQCADRDTLFRPGTAERATELNLLDGVE